MLPAVEAFVSTVRGLFEQGLSADEVWPQACEPLKEMLRDPAVAEHAKTWPTSPAKLGLEGKHANLLFYEDPDHGFVINGLIKNPGGLAVPHDHGKAWTVYGVLAGGERIVQMHPGENGFTEGEASECGPGDVDIVPPWKIHAEYAGDEKTIAVIVRSQRSGTFEQYRHNDDGTKTRFPGPNQVPFELA